MSHRFIPPIPVISYLRGAAKGEERAEGACQRYGMMHRDQMLITHVEDPLKNHPPCFCRTKLLILIFSPSIYTLFGKNLGPQNLGLDNTTIFRRSIETHNLFRYLFI